MTSNHEIKWDARRGSNEEMTGSEPKFEEGEVVKIKKASIPQMPEGFVKKSAETNFLRIAECNGARFFEKGRWTYLVRVMDGFYADWEDYADEEWLYTDEECERRQKNIRKKWF